MEQNQDVCQTARNSSWHSSVSEGTIERESTMAGHVGQQSRMHLGKEHVWAIQVCGSPGTDVTESTFVFWRQPKVDATCPGLHLWPLLYWGYLVMWCGESIWKQKLARLLVYPVFLTALPPRWICLECSYFDLILLAVKWKESIWFLQQGHQLSGKEQ